MSLYADRNERIDRWIEGFQAVAGVTSLGSWAYFKAFPEVWSAIIVFSQIIAAIKDQFPFKKRIKPLIALHYDLNRIAIAAEKEWFLVASGTLSNQQIHDMRMGFRSNANDLITKHFGDTILVLKPKLVDRAETMAQGYFAEFKSSGT